MFYDKTCNISTISYTKVGWSSKRTETALYTWIECNFEVSRKGIKETDTSKNNNILKYEVTVPIQYNLIKNNYNIELIDNNLWSLWDFIISDIQSFSGLSWIDCINFIASKTEWQL